MTAETEGSASAAQFRRDHHLGVQPLGDLVAVIEQATGIDVAVLDVGPDEHGLTMRDPVRRTTFIGVARTRNPMRQRSTLAHELGHVLFEDWAASDAGDWSDRNPAEIRADAFARHLLVPAEGLRDFIGDQSSVGVSTLSGVVQRFLISPPIAAIALFRARYIDEATKQDWMTLTTPQLAARFGWADQYQVLQASSDRRRAPQRLLARAIAGYVEGVLPAQAVATLRGIGVETLVEELSEAGVTPAERPVAWADPGELPDADSHLLGDFERVCQVLRDVLLPVSEEFDAHAYRSDLTAEPSGKFRDDAVEAATTTTGHDAPYRHARATGPIAGHASLADWPAG